ncbi:HAD family hydrolase [Glaciihabitans arcticus]|uniref:HAD family hydrolase n=1 Tax=Glaciihabitans arcticus TaxID=2668039 RepID=A0A4Q9GZT0_9MICO|nr:HAD family hydrolase [Glaciihabitans arcticus]TBN58343.1 HAD family hydrolase [Glaciihabitans arcticus]
MASPFAVLLDIDGTLVDSNFLHVDAWQQGFQQTGLTVPAWRIQRAIGADSSKLLDLLITSESDAVKNEAKARNSAVFETLIPRLELFAGAREFIEALASEGARVVLATSAPPEELKALLKVLDVDEHLHAVTSADDVETAKPEPDIIHVALEKGEVAGDRAVMIGDSVWDVIAAGKAGVPCIALLSGGTGRAELLEAGAVAVFDDIADLHEHAGDQPLHEFLSAL